MKKFCVDATLTFSFPDTWKVEKCDNWSFYKKFVQVGNVLKQGMKCVDLMTIDDKNVLWLIEVKDYRHHIRQKEICPDVEFCKKIIDTISMLFPAACNAEENERSIAKDAVRADKIRIVLHYEQSKFNSKLFPRQFDLDDLQLKIRRCLKCIDPHPIVTDMSHMPACIRWRVQ